MIPDADALLATRKNWQSIRINTLKIDFDTLAKRLKERYDIRPVPWFQNGLFVRGDLAKTPEHFLGYFGIQGAASMVPPIALEPSADDIVLDMCAAPGSKTAQMANMMENTGLIVANDVDLKRLRALSHNIQKSGAVNVVVTGFDARFIDREGFSVSKILLDAPCTASGRIINNLNRIHAWNIHRIRHMSSVQKMLIRAAVECLAENGIIVYSTCSLEPEENEEVIAYVLERFPDLKVEPVSFSGLVTRPALSEWADKVFTELDGAIRVWPQDNETEGFFICKLRKC